MDWTTLTSAKSVAGSLANWVNNSTVTTGANGVADVIVGEALSWISQRLRHWRMLIPPATGTMTIGQDYVTTPTDVQELKDFYITGTSYQRLEMRPEEEVIASWSYDGAGTRVNQQPVMFYQNQTRLAFDSPPDLAYPYALTYYQIIPALSGSATTNFVTTYYPRLLRAACMVGLSEWTKESGAGQYDRTYWTEQTLDALDGAQRDSDQAMRSTVAGPIYIGGGVAGFPPYGV